MGTIFSETLVKLRKEAGFKTAYSFFHDNGGKGVLKASYRMYLLIEQGKRLPPFKNLGTYIFALRLSSKSHAAMELTAAWLKTTHGEEDFAQLIEPFFKIPQEQSISSPLHKATKMLLAQKKFYISPEQLKVIVTDRTTSLCWTALFHDTGTWTPKALAAEIGLSPAVAEKNMRMLALVKLLKRMKDGTYKCPLAGAMVEYPHANNMDPDIRKKFQTIYDEMISSGEPIVIRGGVLRASLPEFSNCFPLLAMNVSIAKAYAITKKQKYSALFAVECKVTKIRDF